MLTDGSARRLHFWSGVIILSIFLSGAVAGAGVFALVRPPAPPRSYRGFSAHLSELGLTPEQHEKAKPILAKHRATVEAALKETFPQVRAADEQLDRELRPILTDTQRRTLDEILARRRPPQRKPGFHGPPSGGPDDRRLAGDTPPAPSSPAH